MNSGATICIESGCSCKVFARSLCAKHYQAHRRNGDPLPDPVRRPCIRPKPGTLRFLGQEFDTREQLAKAFPAFAGDDAIRAIREGAQTPLEVETACWQRRNRGAKGKANQQANRNALKKGLSKVARASRGRKAA